MTIEIPEKDFGDIAGHAREYSTVRRRPVFNARLGVSCKKNAFLGQKAEDSGNQRSTKIKYKTLVIGRGVRGHKFRKQLKIRVPVRLNAAEKKLLRYILESLSRRSCLIPFVLNSSSTMAVARHLLFNRTGSPLTFYRFVDDFYSFCRWIKAEPDQLLQKCQKSNGEIDLKGIAETTKKLEEYADYMLLKNLARGTVSIRLKAITSIFSINGVGVKLPYGLSVWSSYDERVPSREDITQILDLADLRERVIITILAVSGLRIGTLLKLQYRHVKEDFERGVVPIHLHIEAGVTKAKRRSYDTFLNEEASECLKAYLKARLTGTMRTPPEHIHDESPLIRSCHSREVKTVTAQTVHAFIHNLYVRAGVLEKNPGCRRYALRTHSFRRFFRTQMASLGVDRDCINFMMGRPALDHYHDVRMKGVEYLRGVYMASGIRIRPKIKMNKIDALKEILQSWGLDPQKILSNEALAQITQPTVKEQADNAHSVIPSDTSQDRERDCSPQESACGFT